MQYPSVIRRYLSTLLDLLVIARTDRRAIHDFATETIVLEAAGIGEQNV